MKDPALELQQLVRMLHDKLWLENSLGYREGAGLLWPPTLPFQQTKGSPSRPEASPATVKPTPMAHHPASAAATAQASHPEASWSARTPPVAKPTAKMTQASRASGPARPTPIDLSVIQPEAGPFLSTESILSKIERLQLLQQKAQVCTRCGLATGRRSVVFGEGNPDAILMFIGEGPGSHEDRIGRPFVGPAGQLLDRIIQAIGMKREEVYIANVVKCHPPGDRIPHPEEVVSCLPYLLAQIELVKPKVICLLGVTATASMTGRAGGITRLRGQWYEFKGVPMMATYHPAYLLRYEGAKKECWLDMQKVRDKVNEIASQT